MNQHVLDTGCAGFIGSHLTDRLATDGHTLVGIDSFEDHYVRRFQGPNPNGANLNGVFASLSLTLREANRPRPPTHPRRSGLHVSPRRPRQRAHQLGQLLRVDGNGERDRMECPAVNLGIAPRLSKGKAKSPSSLRPEQWLLAKPEVFFPRKGSCDARLATGVS